jgi:hypothetical protein
LLNITAGELVDLALAPAPALPSQSWWANQNFTCWLGTIVGENLAEIFDLWAVYSGQPNEWRFHAIKKDHPPVNDVWILTCPNDPDHKLRFEGVPSSIYRKDIDMALAVAQARIRGELLWVQIQKSPNGELGDRLRHVQGINLEVCEHEAKYPRPLPPVVLTDSQGRDFVMTIKGTVDTSGDF